MFWNFAPLQSVLVGSVSASAAVTTGYGFAQFYAMKNFIAMRNRLRITDGREKYDQNGEKNVDNREKEVKKQKEESEYDSSDDEDPDNPELVVDHYIQRAKQILERQKSQNKFKPSTPPSRFSLNSISKEFIEKMEENRLDLSFGRILDGGLIDFLRERGDFFVENLSLLNLTQNVLSSGALQYIFGGKFEMKSLEVLILNENEVGEEGVEVLCSFLEQKNCHLKVLEIAKNRIGSKGIERILSKIASNQDCKLETLKASGNVVETRRNSLPWNSALLLSLSDSLLRMNILNQLDLSFNGITQLGFKHLADMIQHSLQSNPQKRNFSLKRLDLCSCDIEYGLAFVSGFLSGFSSLQEIHLGSNQKISIRDVSSSPLKSSSGFHHSDSLGIRRALFSSKEEEGSERIEKSNEESVKSREMVLIPFELPSLREFSFGLTHLDLSCNDLGCKPLLWPHLLSLISSCELISNVDLSGNSLGLDSQFCQNLARELSCRKRLKCLDISENELEDNEFNFMLRVLCNGDVNLSSPKSRSHSIAEGEFTDSNVSLVSSTPLNLSPKFPIRNSADSPKSENRHKLTALRSPLSRSDCWESPSSRSGNFSPNGSSPFGSRRGIRLNNLIAANNRIKRIDREGFWGLLWTLKVLNLNDNQLEDEGAQEILNCILQHKESNLRNRFGLAEIHLTSNGINENLKQEFEEEMGEEVLLDL
eukprot:TRINITY_DN6902_c0_g1_i1.p1 TRINITY_DN6902_c0_g1~~TRINITY_DN6902_c0_g1_i1.p1  ORF type:complete len:706 (+),score=240.30 TRINITY_DN6902_c0_g1_i1:338-2455(+)